MTTSAFIGSQSLFQLGNGASPEVFTTVAEATTVGPISVQKDLVEVTHLLSTAKEFIGGLSDGQRIAVTCNLVPTDTNQIALTTAAKTASTAKNFRYVIPATAAGGSKYRSFAAVVMGVSEGATTPNTATQVTFDLKISGPVSDWT